MQKWLAAIAMAALIASAPAGRAEDITRLSK
jgi:hypothetical protein